MIKTSRRTFLAGLAAVAAVPAHASITLPVAPVLQEAGWEMLTFDGIPPSMFRGLDGGVIEVYARESSSVLYRAVGEQPVKADKLSWDWQVLEGLPATDLTQTDGDDRVLAIHVVFADDSLAARLRGMVSPMARGNVLTYVWGDDMKAAFPHPHLPERGWMSIKRTSATPYNEWFNETVDLAADYKKAFGKPAPKVAFIGVSSDADDLATYCLGRVKNIRLM